MNQDILLYFGDIYRTGINKIDDQHRSLFIVLNDIFNICASESGIENLDKHMAFLEDYAGDHFETEEKFMRQYDYSRYWIHQQEHENFKKIFFQYKEVYNQINPDIKYLSIVINLVIQWLIKHINDEDMLLAGFLRLKMLEKYKNYGKTNLKIINISDFQKVI